MTGISKWSFSRFTPIDKTPEGIYLCRVIPSENGVHLEWKAENSLLPYIVEIKDENETTAKSIETNTCEADIDGLISETDYEVCVFNAEAKSDIRKFRTGYCVGIPVNYLHPKDSLYEFSGQYLCSPTLLRLDETTLLAGMDVYKRGAPQNLELIFKSSDNANTWHHLAELYPCFWGNLFLHKGNVYMISCSTENGDLLIGCSTDNAENFGTPSVLLRGACKCDRSGVQKNPQPVIHYKGRVWSSLEFGGWQSGGYGAMVMSADENEDLLDSPNWHFTPPLFYNPGWENAVKGESKGILEGCLCVFPDGGLRCVMRYEISSCEPNYGKAVVLRVNEEDFDAELVFDKIIDFPGNHAKFEIKFDETSGCYYSIVSYIASPENSKDRNVLALIKSKDCEHWELTKVLIDYSHVSRYDVGFQYVDFHIEGNDIIYLCRTGMNGAQSFHDTNYSTFHRIDNFRQINGNTAHIKNENH